MDVEVSTVKTAAQKKKEKKEREKQKKLAQKKSVNKEWNLFIVHICLMWELFIPILIVKNCNRKLPRNPTKRQRTIIQRKLMRRKMKNLYLKRNKIVWKSMLMPLNLKMARRKRKKVLRRRLKKKVILLII